MEACLPLGKRGKARNRWSTAGSCWRWERWSLGVPPREVPTPGRSIRLPVTGGAPLPPRPPGWGTEYPLPPLVDQAIALFVGVRYFDICWKVASLRRGGALGPVCWRHLSRERGAEVTDRQKPRPRWRGRDVRGSSRGLRPCAQKAKRRTCTPTPTPTPTPTRRRGLARRLSGSDVAHVGQPRALAGRTRRGSAERRSRTGRSRGRASVVWAARSGAAVRVEGAQSVDHRQAEAEASLAWT